MKHQVKNKYVNKNSDHGIKSITRTGLTSLDAYVGCLTFHVVYFPHDANIQSTCMHMPPCLIRSDLQGCSSDNTVRLVNGLASKYNRFHPEYSSHC